MKDVKWIKLDSHLWASPEVKNLISLGGSGYRAFSILIALLCLAGNLMNHGRLSMGEKLMNDKQIAAVLGQSVRAVRDALALLTEYCLLEREGDGYFFPDWDDTQSTDRLERVRELNRERNRQYRDRKKLEDETSFVTSRDATEKIREDKNREDEIREDKIFSHENKGARDAKRYKAKNQNDKNCSFDADEFFEAAVRKSLERHSITDNR